ncbi:MAG: tetratricopeptide repeat protein [Luteolibacter sp.]
METLKPTILPSRGRAALLATACLLSPLFAGEPHSAKNPQAPAVSVTESSELIAKGDEAYNAGRFHDASEAYAGAREMIPDTPEYGELRLAVTQRYVQAAVEASKEMVRKGNLQGAKARMDQVIAATGAPGDPAAVAYRTQLDDPIRTNPALTPEHAKNVDTVRRTLYTAEGAYNLGKYDEAKKHYEEVLRIDPYNTAARRGLERLAQAKSHYQDAAYDSSRAAMLAEVGQQWETAVPPTPESPSFSDLATTQNGDRITISNKLKRIIFPRAVLSQATLEEAVDFLRTKARELDTTETDPNNKGVNITLNLIDAPAEVIAKIRAAKIDLNLSNIPLAEVLRYIVNETGTDFTTDDYSVIITPAGATVSNLVMRTYRVPPDFITSLSGGGSSATAASADPFAEPSSQTGVLAKKLTAQEALAGQGITFPEGAIATYIPTTNTLQVVNTPTNQDQIAQLVESLNQTEPVAVAVRVTMIKAQENRLKELGFDWLLTSYGFTELGHIFNLSGGSQGNGGDLSDILPTGITSMAPITAGNRSGNAAIQGDSIDAVIASGSARSSDASIRAPGILGLTGLYHGAVVQVVMRGLDQKKGVDIMGQPSVITRSGQAATVNISREMLYPTEYEPPKLPQNTASKRTITYDATTGEILADEAPNSPAVTPAHPTSFKKRDTGTILEVLPIADANKQYISLSIKPSFTDFDGFVDYGTPLTSNQETLTGTTTVEVSKNSILMPVFNTMQLNTNVTITDGATIVLGGLLKEKMQNVEDKVPILGDVPVVGRLFQSKASSPEKTAIIFLVNAELLDPTGRPYRHR